MSSFPAYVAQEYEAGTNVVQATPDPAGTGATGIIYGSFVFYDTATQLLKICGANPSLILGVSEIITDAAKVRFTAQQLTADGQVPVRVMSPKAIIALSGSGTPLTSQLFNATGYDVVNTSGIWQINTASQANARVVPVEIDPVAGIWYCRILAANLQGDAIVS